MDKRRLVRKVYEARRSSSLKTEKSWCSMTRRLLGGLRLLHVWDTEQVGDGHSWNKLVLKCLADREEDQWRCRVKVKPKLRLYMQLKSCLSREEYLDTCKRDQARLICMFRGGTNELRVETGRWKEEKLEERTCLVCAMGLVEDEAHVLLRCYAYERERKEMFDDIFLQTSLMVDKMWADASWMLDILIGHGARSKYNRKMISQAVGRFLKKVLEMRRKFLKEDNSQ